MSSVRHLGVLTQLLATAKKNDRESFGGMLSGLQCLGRVDHFAGTAVRGNLCGRRQGWNIRDVSHSWHINVVHLAFRLGIVRQKTSSFRFWRALEKEQIISDFFVITSASMTDGHWWSQRCREDRVEEQWPVWHLAVPSSWRGDGRTKPTMKRETTRMQTTWTASSGRNVKDY